MEPTRAQQSPPPVIAEDRNRSARSQHEEAVKAWGEDVHATHANAPRVHHEGSNIEGSAGTNHDRHKTEIVAQPAQRQGEAPHPRIAAATVKTNFVLSAHQLSAGGTDHGSGLLTSYEHSGFKDWPRITRIARIALNLFVALTGIFSSSQIVPGQENHTLESLTRFVKFVEF